jgi:hypothetical protein
MKESQMDPLPVKRAHQLQIRPDEQRWLIESLWSQEAVGVLGGEPKCCKTFLALDIAVSVASGAPCLRHFSVHSPGPVLMFPAEDALEDIRRRLDGICAAADKRLQDIPIHVITVPRLYLDQDRQRRQLVATVQSLHPRLLILDPFIRLHCVDENHACEIAPILSFLRELQRRFHMAVLLIHHTRKAARKDRPGQALRGSSDLHGWGDSNLYLHRSGNQLQLSVEHRAAPSHNGLALQLHENGPVTALRLCDQTPEPSLSAPQQHSGDERILHALSQASHPLPMTQLRNLCGMRTSTLCDLLRRLIQQNRVRRTEHGRYSLPNTTPTSVSLSLPL